MFGTWIVCWALLGQLPSSDVRVLTGSESRAADAATEALEREIEELEQQIAAARSDRQPTERLEALLSDRQARYQSLMRHPDPAFHELFPLYRDRLQVIERYLPDSSAEPAATPEQVDALAREFYFDCGHPSLNYRMQFMVLLEMNEGASHPCITRDALDAIRDSLVDYYHAGGGVSAPVMELELAELLFKASDSTDTEARNIVDTLYQDAVLWTEQLDRSDEYRRRFESLQASFAAADELRRVERALLNPSATTQPQARSDSASLKTNAIPTDPKRARLEFERMVNRSRWKPESIDRIFRLATAAVGPPSLGREFLERLLIVYRHILRNRAGVSAAVRGRIESHLMLIAKTDRLTTTRLWQLWARAVGAVGSRASPEFKTYVCSEQLTGSHPAVRRALRYACRRLENGRRNGVSRTSANGAKEPIGQGEGKEKNR
ncbi:MAG: hypothetical protein ACE5E1_03340 [Phycisphaerae bacterium]